MLCLFWLGTGCTHYATRREAIERQVVEEARATTTAVVDTLHAQPAAQRDAFTATALVLASQGQRLLGLPERPIEVAPLIAEAEAAATNRSSSAQPIAGAGPATARLEERFAAQNEALARQHQLAQRLQQLGTLREVERNARVGFWTRWLGLGGLGLGGLVALVVLAPAAIPILGRLLGWLVARLPALAGAIGVVGVKAFDASVRAIEHFKHEPPAAAAPIEQPTTPRAASEQLLNQLSREMDADHKALVRQRRQKILTEKVRQGTSG